VRLVFVALIVFTVSCQAGQRVDSAKTIQSQIDLHCESQLPYKLPIGRSYLYTPLIIKTNCEIFGTGSNFSTVLHPIKVSAILIKGSNVEGGWAFRDKLEGFTIDGSDTLEDLIVINKAYSTKINEVFIYNQNSVNGITVNDSNHIQLNEVVLYGETQAGKYGIRISGKSSVTLNDVDIENYSRCLRTEGSSAVDLHSPYMERCVVNIEHVGNGSVNVFGGYLKSINGYNLGLSGDNFTVFGTVLKSFNAEKLDGKVIYCFKDEYANIKLKNVASYSGYLKDTNCPLDLIVR